MIPQKRQQTSSPTEEPAHDSNNGYLHPGVPMPSAQSDAMSGLESGAASWGQATAAGLVPDPGPGSSGSSAADALRLGPTALPSQEKAEQYWSDESFGHANKQGSRPPPPTPPGSPGGHGWIEEQDGPDTMGEIPGHWNAHETASDWGWTQTQAQKKEGWGMFEEKEHWKDDGAVAFGDDELEEKEDSDVSMLIEIGFSRAEALRALNMCNRDVARAADWLLGAGNAGRSASMLPVSHSSSHKDEDMQTQYGDPGDRSVPAPVVASGSSQSNAQETEVLCMEQHTIGDAFFGVLVMEYAAESHSHTSHTPSAVASGEAAAEAVNGTSAGHMTGLKMYITSETNLLGAVPGHLLIIEPNEVNSLCRVFLDSKLMIPENRELRAKAMLSLVERCPDGDSHCNHAEQFRLCGPPPICREVAVSTPVMCTVPRGGGRPYEAYDGRTKAQMAVPLEMWECSCCTLLNEPSRSICDACLSPRHPVPAATMHQLSSAQSALTHQSTSTALIVHPNAQALHQSCQHVGESPRHEEKQQKLSTLVPGPEPTTVGCTSGWGAPSPSVPRDPRDGWWSSEGKLPEGSDQAWEGIESKGVEEEKGCHQYSQGYEEVKGVEDVDDIELKNGRANASGNW